MVFDSWKSCSVTGTSHPTLLQLGNKIDFLSTCCLHEKQADLARSASRVILAACHGCLAGPPCDDTENDEMWLFETVDGKFGVLEESEDYTGHG